MDEKDQNFNFTFNPGTTFDSCLPLIFEDSLNEYVKEFYINLNTYSIQMPWIYIIQNKELCGRDNKYINPDFDKEYKET